MQGKQRRGSRTKIAPIAEWGSAAAEQLPTTGFDRGGRDAVLVRSIWLSLGVAPDGLLRLDGFRPPNPFSPAKFLAAAID